MFAKNVEYLLSATERKNFPNTILPEIAFIGRSNVGKSSLINLLCQRHDLAKTSKTPGATKKINFFRVDEKFILVDLPGYGYAKVSKEQRNHWGKSIEDYLTFREQLILINLLIDARHGIKPQDYEVIEWLVEHQKTFQIVFTKTDKITQSQKHELAKQVADILTEQHNIQLIFTSSRNKDGAKELRHHLVQVLSRSR